jgi:hypothetical protein
MSSLLGVLMAKLGALHAGGGGDATADFGRGCFALRAVAAEKFGRAACLDAERKHAAVIGAADDAGAAVELDGGERWQGRGRGGGDGRNHLDASAGVSFGQIEKPRARSTAARPLRVLFPPLARLYTVRMFNPHLAARSEKLSPRADRMRASSVRDRGLEVFMRLI